MRAIAGKRHGTEATSEKRPPEASGIIDLLRTCVRLLSWRFAALVFITLAIGLVAGTSVVLLLPMLQVVGLDVSGGSGEMIAQQVIRALTSVGIPTTLEAVLVLNALVVTAAALLTRLQALMAARMNQSVVRRLRLDLYRNISDSSWLYLTNQRQSRLQHLLLAELERLGSAISALVSLLVSSGRTIIYGSLALLLSPTLTGITLLMGLILSLLLLRRTAVARTFGQRVSDAYRNLYSTCQEHLAALKLTKSHALEDRQLASFRRAAEQVEHAHVDVVRNQADVSFWLQAGSVVGLSALVYVAFGILELPLTTVLLVLYLFSRLLPLLAGIQRNYQGVLNLLPAFQNYEQAMAQGAAARENEGDDLSPLVLRRGIRLAGVTFRYGDDDGAGVEEADIEIPAGKTVALVGPSGAGKSTIADLVIGLIKPDAGSVLIDGEPLVPRRLRAWRERIGYVSQDAVLFNQSIRENLLLAAPEADQDRLREALEMAAADFVELLPEGMETVIGDRGVRLSGGERQRLVLARALLREPDLLVLDEATSALDAHSEDRVRSAIEALSGRMTILVIAHRLATIRHADRIYFIDSGRVAESGTWDELIAREGGRFRALAGVQGLHEEPAPPASAR